MKDLFFGVLTIATIIIALFTLAYIFTSIADDAKMENMRNKAVAHGCAEWIISDDGRPKFKWKSKNNKI